MISFVSNLQYASPRKTSIMSNLSTCSSSVLQSVPYLYSCGVPVKGSRKSTNNTALLQSCCRTSNISTYGLPDPCFVYCNATSLLQAEQTYWCLGNLTLTNPNNTIEIFGCDYSNNSGSGRGRLTGVLGGGWTSLLVVLSVVASAAASL